MKNKTLNTFLFEFLKTANLNDKRTGSGQPLLNQGIMKSIETVIPEQKVISDFSQLANDFYKKIRENEVEIQSLTKLRDTLLPKLVSGEVRVP